MLSVLYVLGVVLLAAVSVIGVCVLLAGRQLDDRPEGQSGDQSGTRPADAEGLARVAGLVDASVRRTRVAVADLIATDVHRDDLRPSSAEFSRRGRTYTVLGVGMVGLAVALLLGLLLVL